MHTADPANDRRDEDDDDDNNDENGREKRHRPERLLKSRKTRFYLGGLVIYKYDV